MFREMAVALMSIVRNIFQMRRGQLGEGNFPASQIGRMLDKFQKNLRTQWDPVNTKLRNIFGVELTSSLRKQDNSDFYELLVQFKPDYGNRLLLKLEEKGDEVVAYISPLWGFFAGTACKGYQLQLLLSLVFLLMIDHQFISLSNQIKTIETTELPSLVISNQNLPMANKEMKEELAKIGLNKSTIKALMKSNREGPVKNMFMNNNFYQLLKNKELLLGNYGFSQDLKKPAPNKSGNIFNRFFDWFKNSFAHQSYDSVLNDLWVKMSNQEKQQVQDKIEEFDKDFEVFFIFFATKIGSYIDLFRNKNTTEFFEMQRKAEQAQAEKEKLLKELEDDLLKKEEEIEELMAQAKQSSPVRENYWPQQYQQQQQQEQYKQEEGNVFGAFMFAEQYVPPSQNQPEIKVVGEKIISPQGDNLLVVSEKEVVNLDQGNEPMYYQSNPQYDEGGYDPYDPNPYAANVEGQGMGQVEEGGVWGEPEQGKQEEESKRVESFKRFRNRKTLLRAGTSTSGDSQEQQQQQQQQEEEKEAMKISITAAQLNQYENKVLKNLDGYYQLKYIFFCAFIAISASSHAVSIPSVFVKGLVDRIQTDPNCKQIFEKSIEQFGLKNQLQAYKKKGLWKP